MNFPSVKISIIACMAKGFYWGFKAAETRMGIPTITDNELIELSLSEALNFYQQNSSSLENQGIYFFALPNHP